MIGQLQFQVTIYGIISTGEISLRPVGRNTTANTFSVTLDRAVSVVVPYWRSLVPTISGSVWSRVTSDGDTLD